MKKKKALDQQASGMSGIWHNRHPAPGLWPYRHMAVLAYGPAGIWPQHTAPGIQPYRHMALQAYGPAGIHPHRHTSLPACSHAGIWPYRHSTMLAYSLDQHMASKVYGTRSYLDIEIT